MQLAVGEGASEQRVAVKAERQARLQRRIEADGARHECVLAVAADDGDKARCRVKRMQELGNGRFGDLSHGHRA